MFEKKCIKSIRCYCDNIGVISYFGFPCLLDISLLLVKQNYIYFSNPKIILIETNETNFSCIRYKIYATIYFLTTNIFRFHEGKLPFISLIDFLKSDMMYLNYRCLIKLLHKII